MDKELGSSRFHSGTRRYDNGGGYRGGYNRRGGGGGYHHRSRQGGGGGGGYYNNRYRNNRHSGGGGGGGRGRGGGRSVNPHARSNRVSASSTKVDPTKGVYGYVDVYIIYLFVDRCVAVRGCPEVILIKDYCL